MNLNSNLRKFLTLLLMFGSLGWMASTARSAPLTISETPLFLTTNVAPNVIVTLDDSGSMARAYTPDLCGATGYIYNNTCNSQDLNNRWPKSSYANPIYYNPKVTYKPPVNANGTELTTSFDHAWINGYAHSLSLNGNSYYDLATNYRPTAELDLPASTKSHSFMNHYTAAPDLTRTVTLNYATHVHSGPMQGSNDKGSHAPSFTITDYVNQDGSGSGDDPGNNLISVTVSGYGNISDDGTFTGSCDNSKDPSLGRYRTEISGTDLNLCFKDDNAMYGKTVTVTYKVAGSTDVLQTVGATDPVGAYYYVYDPLFDTVNCTGKTAEKKVDNDCYTIRMVSATSGADRDGDGSISPDEADERQNFANWYSFYRTRNLATIAAASLAAAQFNATTRLSWQALNTCNTLPTASCSGWDGVNVSTAIKPFTGTHKQNFYTWLFRLNTDSSTPLRTAMKRAGEYYRITGENSPYDDDLTASGTVSGSSGQLSCRKNFHILMTDGVWSGASPDVGDTDGSLVHPFSGSDSNSLADVAYKYWRTDLTGLTDNVMTKIVEPAVNPVVQFNNPKNDPADWQHMVNFTVGLGLTPFLESVAGGSLTYGDDDPSTPDTYTGSYSALVAGTKLWPTTGADLAGNVADLWHAALNSRGRFFSADSPDELIRDFGEIVKGIDAQTASAAALAANSTSVVDVEDVASKSAVYQAVVDSTDWSGDLKSLPIGYGGVVGAPQWNAASKIPGSRNIFTFFGGSKIDFSGDAIAGYLDTNASGDDDDKGADRLAWIRGAHDKEVRNGGSFRNRERTLADSSKQEWILGDIINSDPAFSHKEDFGYKDMVADEAATYEAYVEEKAGHTPAVYVGANDGMLHAFHAESGIELFGFVPGAVYPNLSKLTDPYYSHQYYVDGGPTVGDAYLSGVWSTVLVGGLGGGGKSVYALNVSNVTSPSASMAMWEYTDTDLGLTYSKPQIARLNNDEWVAIFGNGYNSTSERAYLYVVNLKTGAQIAKIPAGSATSNGLSTPVLYDANDDKIIDYAYAGDLQGNLWKFDLTSFADQTTPLFVAYNGKPQPITAQPVVGGHPDGGVLVYFGTGQYLQGADVADPVTNVPNTDEQTFYAIWDNGASVLRSQLQQQSIVAATSEFGKTLRETTANTVDWASKLGWYIDFDQPMGERVVSHALLKYGRVIFSTVVPSTNVCEAGGYSWIMDLDAVTGARSTTGSNYDFNNDHSYDDGDYLASGAAASGIKTTVGISKTPAWFEGVDIQGNKTGTDYMVWTGTLGGTESIGTKAPVVPGGGGGALRRVYWLQIQ